MLLIDIAAPSPGVSPASLINQDAPWSRSDKLALFQVVAGAIAIVISIAAFRIANRQGRIAEQNVFQRTVLLDLAALLDVGIPDKHAAATRVALLPNQSLGFWRVWLRWRFEDDGEERIDEALRQMKVPDSLDGNDRILWGLREALRSEAARAGHPTSKVDTSRDTPEPWGFYGDLPGATTRGIFGRRGGPFEGGKLRL